MSKSIQQDAVIPVAGSSCHPSWCNPNPTCEEGRQHRFHAGMAGSFYLDYEGLCVETRLERLDGTTSADPSETLLRLGMTREGDDEAMWSAHLTAEDVLVLSHQLARYAKEMAR